MHRTTLMIGLVCISCFFFPQPTIAQDKIILAAILELPSEDKVTFDANTIVKECTKLLAERAKHSPETVVKALWARGGSYIALEKYRAAKRDFDDLCALKPRYADAYCARAEVLALLKTPVDALADSKEALRLAPQSPLAHLSLASRMLQVGRLKESLEWVEKAIVIDPKLPAAYYMRARIYEFVNPAKCLESLNKYLELAPYALITDHAPDELLALHAFSLLNLNRTREALSSYLAARKLNPKSPAIVRQLAYTYGSLGRFGLAAHYAREYVKLDSGSAESHIIVAMFSAKAGEAKAALEAAGKAVSRGGNDPLVFSAAGDTYFALGRYAEALTHYDLALEKDPKDLGALTKAASFLATCPERKYRNGARAVKLARVAYEPKHWPQWRMWEPGMVLAEALAETGAFEDAVHYALEAVDVAGPEFGGRDEFLQKLASFEKKMPWRANVKMVQPGE